MFCFFQSQWAEFTTLLSHGDGSLSMTESMFFTKKALYEKKIVYLQRQPSEPLVGKRVEDKT
jgi:hypothetical protein